MLPGVGRETAVHPVSVVPFTGQRVLQAFGAHRAAVADSTRIRTRLRVAAEREPPGRGMPAASGELTPIVHRASSREARAAAFSSADKPGGCGGLLVDTVHECFRRAPTCGLSSAGSIGTLCGPRSSPGGARAFAFTPRAARVASISEVPSWDRDLHPGAAQLPPPGRCERKCRPTRRLHWPPRAQRGQAVPVRDCKHHPHREAIASATVPALWAR
jgi:hypothetical protein